MLTFILTNYILNPAWYLGNGLWVIFSFVFAFLFIRFIPGSVMAILIARKILRDNRDTRGNGWGKYSADRFLDVWYSSEKLPLAYLVGTFYYKTFNNPNSRHWMDVIDKELVALGLIRIAEAQRGYKAVFAVRTWRNHLVAKFVKWYLVKFVGDNPQYYRDMEAQRKNNDIHG